MFDTTEAILAAIDELAAMEVVCSKLLPLPEPPCEDWCACYGTGKVARFPGLRRECGNSWHRNKYLREQFATCPSECDDTGEVPNYDAHESAVLAGLSILQTRDILWKVTKALAGESLTKDWDTTQVPPADEIRLALLRAVEEVLRG